MRTVNINGDAVYLYLNVCTTMNSVRSASENTEWLQTSNVADTVFYEEYSRYTVKARQEEDANTRSHLICCCQSRVLSLVFVSGTFYYYYKWEIIAF